MSESDENACDDCKQRQSADSEQSGEEYFAQPSVRHEIVCRRGVRGEAVSGNMAGGEDRISHPDVSGQVAVALGQFDGAANCRDWRSDYKDQVRSARRVVRFHAHNVAFTSFLRQ